MADTAVREMYERLMEALGEIDTTLDALSGSKDSLIKNVHSDLSSNTKNIWGPVADNLVTQLSNLDTATLAGVLYGITDTLKDAFDKDVKAHVKGIVDAMPEQDKPQISEEELKELTTQRSDLYGKIKQVVNLAESVDGVKLELPRVRKGSMGKKGPRRINQMKWAIDGVEIDGLYKDVAAQAGFDSSKDMTAWLKTIVVGEDDKGKEVKLDIKTFESLRVDLPNGKELYAYLPGADDVNDDDEDEEDEDED